MRTKKVLKQSHITAIMGILSALFAILTGLSMVALIVFTGNISALKTEQYELTSLSAELELTCNTISTYAGNYIGTADEKYLTLFQQATKDKDIRKEIVDKLNAHNLTDEEHTMLLQLYNTSNIITQSQSSAVEYVKNASESNSSAKSLYTTLGMNQMYNSIILESASVIEKKTDSFNESITSRMNAEIAQANQGVTFCTIASVSLAVLLLAFALLNMAITRRKVTTPLLKLCDSVNVLSRAELGENMDHVHDTSEIGVLSAQLEATRVTLNQYIGEISHILTEISDKNIDVGAEYDYIGDFSPIKTALNTIVSSLNEVFSHINASTRQFSESARMIAEEATSLSNGAAIQTEAVDRLTEAVSEISRMAQESDQKTQSAMNATKNAKNRALSGQDKMSEMVSAMDAIRDASGDISHIIKTIDNISFQTNILALNASVEAARAGAAGKGFAVVAGEVRNLANRCAEATKDSAEIIERTLDSVESGTSIAQEVNESFQRIVGEIENASVMVTEIASALHAQVTATDRISQEVHTVSDVVATVSATAQESSAASEELLNQAMLLEEMVREFKLKGNAYHQPQIAKNPKPAEPVEVITVEPADEPSMIELDADPLTVE